MSQLGAGGITNSDDFEFLALAGEQLGGSLDYDETLKNIIGLVVSRLADFCWVISDGRGPNCVLASGWADSSANCSFERHSEDTEAIHPAPVLKELAGQSDSRLLNEGELRGLAEQLGNQAKLPRSGVMSAVITPMSTPGKAVGFLLSGRFSASFSPSDWELPLIEAVARRAAVALEHAWLFQKLEKESALRQRAEARLRQLVESNIVGIVLSNFDGIVLEANDAFLNMIGRRQSDVAAGEVTLAKLSYDDDEWLYERALDQLKESGVCEPFEKTYIGKDGALVPALVVAARLENDTADVVAMVLDISDRRRAEVSQQYLDLATRTLSSSLDYETTLHNLAKLLVPQLADWCVVHLMENGRPKQVAVAHADPDRVRWAIEIQKRYPPNMESDEGLSRVLRTGEPELWSVIPEEMLIASAQDEEHLEIIRQAEIRSAMVVPMKVLDETIGAITFVSSQFGKYQSADLALALELGRRAAISVDHARVFRSVERTVEARTEELQAANKELESFAYSVSHDLRAPLRSIMSAAMIVTEDFGDRIGTEGRGELARAAAAAKRMSKLIDDLLQYSRLGRREMNRAPTDLSVLCSSIAKDLLSQEAAEPPTVEIEPGIRVDADSDLLRVLLQNLLENAWKFSRGRPNAKIEVGASDDNGRQVFFVKDNGVGFDEQFADKLFVPFERLHSPADYPGTGIGLANVKRIVTRHGGQIWASSKLGEGANFCFTLAPDDPSRIE